MQVENHCDRRAFIGASGNTSSVVDTSRRHHNDLAPSLSKQPPQPGVSTLCSDNIKSETLLRKHHKSRVAHFTCHLENTLCTRFVQSAPSDGNIYHNAHNQPVTAVLSIVAVSPASAALCRIPAGVVDNTKPLQRGLGFWISETRTIRMRVSFQPAIPLTTNHDGIPTIHLPTTLRRPVF